MKLKEFLDRVEIQSEFVVVYFDSENMKRVEVKEEDNLDKEINAIYSENDVLYIEVDV